MKHNHRDGTVKRNDKNRLYDKTNDGVYHLRSSTHRDARFHKSSEYSSLSVNATPSGYEGSGKSLQRGIHGAKHFLRSRIRFHDKATLQKQINEGFPEDNFEGDDLDENC